jgi:glycosyltransferase involved in cell wall biosynthesis
MQRSEEGLNDPLIENLSVVLLTFNEVENIARTLSALKAFAEVVVIDSFSDDGTIEVFNNFHNVRYYQRAFDTHTQQWNFGLSNANKTWILALDADYLLTDDLLSEIRRLDFGMDSYAIPFRYCVDGQPLSGSILPPRVALFNKHKCSYVQDGHTQRLVVSGTCGRLQNPILHDDRKSLERWLWAQDRYTRLEQLKLASASDGLPLLDRVRSKTVLAPILVFGYCYFWKKGFLDGKRGLFYALQRTYVELLLKLHLMDAKYSTRTATGSRK